MLSRADAQPLTDDHGVYGSPGDLSPWDIRFDPSNRAFLDTNSDGSVRFRVWSDPSLTEGMLVIRAGESVAGYAMSEAARTIRFVYWEVVAGPFDAEVQFSFAFRAPNGKGVYRVPAGVSNAVERTDRWTLNAPPPLTVPEWAKGALIYQIFPDRYDRSEWAHDVEETWDSPHDRFSFKGGDLAGVTQRLDHLSSLGVDLIYLNPIFRSPSNHRYDTVDYYTVDPLLGGNEALRKLVDEAHARSIRVILDAAFNHVHPWFFAFSDVVERGPDSDYWNWFIIDKWPVEIRYRADRASADPRFADYIDYLGEQLGFPLVADDELTHGVRPSFQAWYSVPTMPRVDLSNPDARKYMLDVAEYWLKEYDVDGWRMDVVRYVDDDFWSDFRKAVRLVKPDAYLMSEIMGDASSWLQGDQFDSTMNYTFRDLCTRFFAVGDLEGGGMVDGLSRLWAQYAWPVTLSNQNLIGSHDVPRFLTIAGGDVWRLRLATILQMTMAGAPGIYYGDEVGLEGGEDPGSRGTFPWNGESDTHEVHRTIAELAELRKAEPALVTGEWRPVHGDQGVIAFERSLDGRTLLVAINRDNERRSLAGEGVSKVLWGNATINGALLHLEPRSGTVVQ